MADRSSIRARTLPRLKWHMLRRRKSDPPFLRDNLAAALRSGAACEVDIRLTADGHAVCLHDKTLQRETTGQGRVADVPRAAVEALLQRGADADARHSGPLFLDEVAASVAMLGTGAPARVQLDVKLRASDLTTAVLDRIAQLLGDSADSYIASAYDWDTVQRIVGAVPGVHAGFDPLAFYPRSMGLDAHGFRRLAARTLTAAPTASIYYLEAKLILAALAQGVDLVGLVTAGGAEVDAWTVDADLPGLHDVLARLIEVGCHQITSNDPELLGLLLSDIAS